MKKTKETIDEKSLDDALSELRSLSAKKKSLEKELTEVSDSFHKLCMDVADARYMGKAFRLQNGNCIKVGTIMNVYAANEEYRVYIRGEMLMRCRVMGVDYQKFMSEGNATIFLGQGFVPSSEFDDVLHEMDLDEFQKAKKEAIAMEKALSDHAGRIVHRDDIVAFNDVDGNLIHGTVLSFDKDEKCFEIGYPFTRRSGIDNHAMSGEGRIKRKGSKILVLKNIDYGF